MVNRHASSTNKSTRAFGSPRQLLPHINLDPIAGKEDQKHFVLFSPIFPQKDGTYGGQHLFNEYRKSHFVDVTRQL